MFGRTYLNQVVHKSPSLYEPDIFETHFDKYCLTCELNEFVRKLREFYSFMPNSPDPTQYYLIYLKNYIHEFKILDTRFKIFMG